MRQRAELSRHGVALMAAFFISGPSFAAEGGGSLFVPGLSVPGGGLTPPPGFYFDNTQFFYDGLLQGQRSIAIGGNVVAGVRARIWADFVTGMWVTPAEIFGGRLAFALTVPFGVPEVRAGAIISGPAAQRLLGRPIGIRATDATLNFGDPVATVSLGWDAGNWHWKLAAAASIPAGAYQPGELSNLAFNRWIGDFSAGVTYLDPELGLDISTVVGFAANGKNPDTDYRSGQEFHIDFGITKNLTKQLSIGLLASHYQQLTGDSGAGATVGPFKGRVTALGGTIGYNFTVGSVPVTAQVKVLREIDAKNRPQGTIGWLQLSFPLSASEAPASARPAAIKKQPGSAGASL